MDDAPRPLRATRTEVSEVRVGAAPADVFAFVDDHRQLASHMSEPSWRTLGSSMRTDTDERHGQAVGSRITMTGSVLGARLRLDEVVTRREPPLLKEWQTVDAPRLLVVGHYRMRVEVAPEKGGSLVRVGIEYERPAEHPWLGRVFGRAYARWCVRQMTRDVAARFAPSGSAAPRRSGKPLPGRPG